MLTSDSAVYLCIWLSLCASAFMSSCVGSSLWACHLWTCLSAGFCIFVPPTPPPHPAPLSFYTVCPHDSQYGDSIPYQLIVFCLRPSSPTAVYPVPSDTLGRLSMIFCLFLRLSPPPTEPAVVSNQNNIFKNSVNITPTNSEGLLVGYSCIQVYIVSWWRCIRSAGGAQHGNSIKIWCIHS